VIYGAFMCFAKRIVEHLERSGFVVMKRPPIGGSAPALHPD